MENGLYFHLNQSIILLIFFLKPHTQDGEAKLCTLDVKRMLAFYLEQTKQFRRSPKLFIAREKKCKRNAISVQISAF